MKQQNLYRNDNQLLKETLSMYKPTDIRKKSFNWVKNASLIS